MRGKMFGDFTAWLSSVLMRGRENAVSRDELRKRSGLKDRALRSRIEQARREGLCIANEQNGNGYYIPATKEEVTAQIKQVRARAMALLAQLRALKNLLREIEEGEQYGERKFG